MTQEIEGDKPVVAETPVVEEVQLSEDEKTALAKGWKPKDQWEGPEDEWKPAKVFNEIGELRDAVVNKDKELKKTNKVLEMVKQHHLRVREAAVAEAIKTLKAERDAALENQDFASAEKLRDKLDDLKSRGVEDPLPHAIERQIRQETSEPDPELYKFMDRNPWYKPNSKEEMSQKADALGWAYKLERPTATFKEIIELVEKDIKKMFPEKFDTPHNPVNESGSRGTGSGSGAGRVKLSEEEAAVAKAFGMTPAEYAKELAKYGGR